MINTQKYSADAVNRHLSITDTKAVIKVKVSVCHRLCALAVAILTSLGSLFSKKFDLKIASEAWTQFCQGSRFVFNKETITSDKPVPSTGEKSEGEAEMIKPVVIATVPLAGGLSSSDSFDETSLASTPKVIPVIRSVIGDLEPDLDFVEALPLASDTTTDSVAHVDEDLAADVLEDTDDAVEAKVDELERELEAERKKREEELLLRTAATFKAAGEAHVKPAAETAAPADSRSALRKALRNKIRGLTDSRLGRK